MHPQGHSDGGLYFPLCLPLHSEAPAPSRMTDTTFSKQGHGHLLRTLPSGRKSHAAGKQAAAPLLPKADQRAETFHQLPAQATRFPMQEKPFTAQ